LRRLIFILMFLSGCQAITPNASEPISALPNRLVTFWETTTGTLEAETSQPFQFVAQGGDAIRATASGDVPFGLTLQAEDGSVIAQSENLLDATLPAGGIYTVLVRATAAGDYRFTLAYTDRPNPADATATPVPTEVVTPSATPPYYARLGTFIETIAGGQSRVGRFDAPEVQHVYTFNGRAGQYIGVVMETVSGTVDPVLHLYAPDASEVASDDNSGDNRAALLRNIRLPEDGLYSLQAWGRGFAGEYRIALTNSTDPQLVTPVFAPTGTATAVVEEVLLPTIVPAIAGELLVNHVPVLGAVERRGDFDRYPIAVTQGQSITIGVRPDGNFRAKVELFDPDGLLIAAATPVESAAGGDALIPAILAGQTGTYVVFVTGEGDSVGGYTIAYGVGYAHLETRRGLTTADQLYSGSIARRGMGESWSLDLNQNDVISVAATVNSGAVDPVLAIIAPDGSLVATDDNTGGSRDAQIVSARAPVGGRYHISVSSANATGEGTYTLVWRIISRPPTPTPLPGMVLLLAYDDSVSANAYGYYSFYAQAGTPVEVLVKAVPGSSLDAVAALLAPDGSVIAEGDDEDANINPRFTATIPADGTYRVRVNGYLTSGAFTLTVNALYPQ